MIGDVRQNGDAALYRMAEEFDRVQLESLEVPRGECLRALEVLEAREPELHVALLVVRDP